MHDSEKVIEGLENIKNAIIAAICYEDGYGSERDLNCLDDAITLLKEQEPRVLTLGEAANADIVWAENNGKDGKKEVVNRYCEAGLYWPDKSMRVYYPGSEVPLMPDPSHYGKTWRCWASRPTDEQREATPWNMT